MSTLIFDLESMAYFLMELYKKKKKTKKEKEKQKKQ